MTGVTVRLARSEETGALTGLALRSKASWGYDDAFMAAFLDACRARGLARVWVDADPNAEPVYARFGFRTVGQSQSGSIPGRMLPRMELDLSGEA